MDIASHDILIGADAIAEFVFGSASKKRRIYGLVERHHFPHFRIGAIIAARKSVIIGWIESQESGHAAPLVPAPPRTTAKRGRKVGYVEGLTAEDGFILIMTEAGMSSNQIAFHRRVTGSAIRTRLKKIKARHIDEQRAAKLLAARQDE